MKTHRFHLISMVSIALFVALAVGASVEKVQTIADHDGILDFSFVKPGYVVKLQGSWEYQDNQLYNDQVEQPDISQNGQTGRQSPSVDLPHYFSHPAGDLKSYSGFATYRIHLENLDPRVDYGIFIQEESSAYRLRANGQVIANYGQVGRDSSAYKPGLNPRLAVFRPDLSGQAEIAIELANFDDPRGGFWSIPKIGQYEDVLALFVREQLVEMFLFTANITMSLIFLALYARSSQDRHILQAKKEDLENEIVLDRLTGAYNRHFLEYRIDEMIRQAAALNQPLSQIMLDLDDFKLVNDSYGHETGDQVLKKTVEIIKKGIRSTDPLIRWGGEEFLILAPNTDLSGAQILAEKLLQTISETDFVPADKVTASIGVTERLSSESAESWFNRTDMALYRAKSTGKNRVCV